MGEKNLAFSLKFIDRKLVLDELQKSQKKLVKYTKQRLK